MTQYVSRGFGVKDCIECKCAYEPSSRTQKYCTPHCRETQKTKMANALWADKVPDEMPKKVRFDVRRAMYRDFKDKAWSGRQYNACRG